MKEIMPSSTMSTFQLANEKKAKGEKVFNFAAGDPVIENHAAFQEAVHENFKTKMVPYPPADGIVELREAYGNWLNKTCKTNYAVDEIAVTCGGKFALFAALSCFLNSGDEVIVVAPYYVSYPGIVAILDGKLNVIQAKPENGWKITGQDIMKRCSANTKILILNNACNPTGVLYSKEELLDILEMAHSLNLIVISDEVYSSLIYDTNQEFVSCGIFEQFKKNVLIVQSCSKNFAMSGWRVGFLLGEKSKIQKIKSFQQQTTSGVSLVSQWGALGASLKGDEVNIVVHAAFKKRLSLFVETFNSLFDEKIPMPSSALYAFVPLSAMGISDMSAIEFADYLINEANVAVVAGEAFGTKGYVRFSCSEREDEIREGVHALYAACQKLNDW